MVGDPSVSVVMAVRNGARTLAAALASIEAQGPAVDEVVVALGPSSDGSSELLSAMAGRNPPITVLENASGTTPAGLNLAVRESSGDIVVRVDAQSVLPRDYVERAIAELERTGADVVGGIQHPVGETIVERAIAAAMGSAFGSGGAAYRVARRAGPVDTVYLGVFRRSALERTGGFDESLLRNQDYELNHRIRAGGGVVWLNPALEVSYRPRPSLRALWAQYFGYGTWKRAMLRRHPGSARLRQLLPPLFVITLVVSIGLIAVGRLALGLVVPGLYAAAALVSTAYAALRRADRALLLMPVALAVMHVAWGLGFLVGRAGGPQRATSR